MPQLISRLAHPNPYAQRFIKEVLVTVLLSYPLQAIWSIGPVVKSKDRERKLLVKGVIEEVDGALKRSTDKKAGLQVDSAMKLFEVLIGVCDSELKQKEQMLSVELHFKALHKIRKNGHVLVPTQSALTVTLPSSAVSSASSTASTLSPNSQVMGGGAVDSAMAHQAFTDQPVLIANIDDSIQVLTSKERPRKLTVLGSDGHRYIFLCKKEVKGDMRKNSRMMEFCSVVNRLLKKDNESRGRQLRLRTFSVLPLTEECGVIEWVPHTYNFRMLVKEMQERNGIVMHSGDIKRRYQQVNEERKKRKEERDSEHDRERKTAAVAAGDVRGGRRKVDAASDGELMLYRQLLELFPPHFHQWFLHAFPDPTCWFQSRLSYAHSVATWSMVGFVVGLGDRHGENILVDGKNGESVHVDFDCFPELDTRVLTDHGFLFLSQIEERNREYQRSSPGKEVLYGCYEVASMEVKYCKGRLVYSASPQEWVEFQSEGDSQLWKEDSGPYGTDGLLTAGRGETKRRRVSLRVTPNHDMFVQLGNKSSGASEGSVWWRREDGVERPPQAMKASEVLSCDATHVRVWACAQHGYEPPSRHRRRAVQAALSLSNGQFEAFLELLGFWLGDGTLSYHRSGNGGYVRFSQVKKTDVAWLKDALEEAGLHESQWSSGACGKERILLIKQPVWFAWFDEEFGARCMRSAPNMPPEAIKSAKHLPAWALQELSCEETQLLLAGLHRADGSFKAGQNEIHTSGVAFRDQLVQALLHCGYSPCAKLQYKKGATRGYTVHGKLMPCKKAEALGKTEKPILATEDGWVVTWTDMSTTQSQASCQPHIRRGDGITRVPYHQRDGRAWCVNVQHEDHLIIAQRAHRDDNGLVTKQSRPIIVGNCLFGKGLTLDTPERVPFRLTANVIDGFGLTGIEGVYRTSCEVTMKVMKENAQTLLSVLHTFLYDPLLEWKQSGGQPTQSAGPSLVNLLPPPAAVVNAGGGAALQSLEFTTAAEKLSEVELKLSGVVNVHAKDSFPLSVNAQVDSLIKEACSEHNLAQMYMGWMPWI